MALRGNQHADQHARKAARPNLWLRRGKLVVRLYDADRWNPSTEILEKHKSESPWGGPSVQVLVNHVTCQLVRDYQKHLADPLWRRLAQDHFVAAVGLNLTVSNAENVSPNFAGITPLLGNGYPIHDLDGPAANPATTVAAFARTLTLGFQVNAAQTNNPTLTYQIDMERIAEAALSDEAIVDQAQRTRDAIQDHSDPRYKEAVWEYEAGRAIQKDSGRESAYSIAHDYCKNDKIENGLPQLLKGDLLQGDLAIEYNIDTGLRTIDATSAYNVYGAGGPSVLADVGPTDAAGPADLTAHGAEAFAAESGAVAPAGARQAGFTTRSSEYVAAVAPAAQAAAPGPGGQGQGQPGGSSQSSSGGASTSFASVVTFNVVAGASGGYAWNLLTFTGPNSGGGGATGGPFGFTRTATDVLTITYAPTCKTNARLALSLLQNKIGGKGEYSGTYSVTLSPTVAKKVGFKSPDNDGKTFLKIEFTVPGSSASSPLTKGLQYLA